ncbi:alcohol dehydrogenase catalytic domain-containing protein [Streptomyces adonidis]|uniref:alcohol dehydrogenase catalytic domain-containing protein n=1 Tax=Streptomyces adonidis TaxID=3231367 RepID=UPI0034DB38DB
MEAAVVRSFGRPLVIEERPDPEPGPGQVRVRVEASGLCHTDIHAAHMVALPAGGTVSVPIFDTVLNGTSVIGSVVGTRQDLDEVFQPHATGRTKVVYETCPLDSVDESGAQVPDGRIKARIVFEM